MSVVISLTDGQAEFLQVILQNLEDVSEDIVVVADAKAIRKKIEHFYDRPLIRVNCYGKGHEGGSRCRDCLGTRKR